MYLRKESNIWTVNQHSVQSIFENNTVPKNYFSDITKTFRKKYQNIKTNHKIIKCNYDLFMRSTL